VLATTIYFGFSFKYFAGLILPLLAVFPLVWRFLHEYQRQRVLTFLDPGKDPLGTSYNVIQSVIAVGSGMLMGRGLGQGTQSGLRFYRSVIPIYFCHHLRTAWFYRNNNPLVCFAFILYKVYTIFKNSDDKFSQTLAAVIFFAFLIQIFVNVGMNIGILPIVGVTLPFVSYGGSSLLSNFIFLGFLSAISKGRRARHPRN